MSEIVVHSRQVVMLPVGALKGYDRNARTHPASQIDNLAAIIRDSGWTQPILIDDDDVIVAGHGRLAVAQKLKMAEVPCVRLSGLTPEQIRSLRLSDNATGLQSAWDDTILKFELGELSAAGFDLSLTGFSSAELTTIFATQEGLTDPDEAPPLPARPVSRLGDLWICGDHRIICGDATSREVVAAVLEGHVPHLCTSDPPYGVAYESGWRSRALKDGAHRAEGGVANDDRDDWREAWALFPGDVIYCWHADRRASNVQASLEASGFELRAQIIWVKSRFVIGRGHYHVGHEPCFYAVRKGTNGHWSGSRKESTVWNIDHAKSDTGHSTQKPVEAFSRPIRNNSQPGDRVFDPFLGSGSSLIAAQTNKRILHGCEINPAYVDVCVTRWQSFSGSEAVLASTGESFAETKERRGATAASYETEDVC